MTMVSELAPEGSSGTAVGYALLFTNAGIIVLATAARPHSPT